MEITRLGCAGPAAREGVHLGPEEQGEIGGDDGRGSEAGEGAFREAFYERKPERASAVGLATIQDAANLDGVGIGADKSRYYSAIRSRGSSVPWRFHVARGWQH